MNEPLPLDCVLEGDCIEVMRGLPDQSVDLVFADPPYNLQLRQELWRPNLTLVDAVDDEWDRFKDFNEYDEFTRAWLVECRRVLKPSGTLWVIGSYHNIHRVGAQLQDLGYWILNEIVWIKNNPMPNFRGVRFTNAHETLLWAQKDRTQPYTFNHHAMKALNEDLQMRSDWYLPICTGKERLRDGKEKLHATQKPLALLYRILLASTQPGDVVLDPFFGTGTSGVAARALRRHFVGIERDPRYVEAARQRIQNQTDPAADENLFRGIIPRREPRIPFGALLENGLISAGQVLYFQSKRELAAVVQADGSLLYNGVRGSIHQIARQIQPGPCNGWQLWFFETPNSEQLTPIDSLRQQLRDRPVTNQESEA